MARNAKRKHNKAHEAWRERVPAQPMSIALKSLKPQNRTPAENPLLDPENMKQNKREREPDDDAALGEGRKLHVSNLAKNTGAVDLASFFRRYIFSNIKIVTHESRSGPVSDYAFVDVDSPTAAQRAIAELHGRAMWRHSPPLSVRLAYMSPPTRKRARRAAEPMPGRSEGSMKLSPSPEAAAENTATLSGDRRPIGVKAKDVLAPESPPELSPKHESASDSGDDFQRIYSQAGITDPEYPTMPATNGVRMYIHQLTEKEQRDQRVYFHRTHPSAVIKCVCCGAEGHMPEKCPAKTCKHCGARDQHFAAACPQYRKCRRCRQRGHDLARCAAPRSVMAGAADDPCDVCGGPGHAEEACAYLWCGARPTLHHLSPEQKVANRLKPLIVGCYNCGSSVHWGDDCPSLPEYVRAGIGPDSVWSAAHVAALRGEGGDGEMGGRDWQLGLLDDGRD